MQPSKQRPFIDAGIKNMDRPAPEARRLEIKVLWGAVVLVAKEFAAEQVVRAGGSGCDLSLPAWPLPAALELAGPGGPDGVVIHQPAGAELSRVVAGAASEQLEAPGLGQVRSVALRLGERLRLSVGQLDFVFQYVQAARGVRTGWSQRLDASMGKVTAMTAIVVGGLWLAMMATPNETLARDDYLANPARFASLIAPMVKPKEKVFKDIEKTEEPKKVESQVQKKAVTDRPTRKSGIVLRKVRPDHNRKVATNTGILRLLKERGGGGKGGNVFGGMQSANLDEHLESLRNTGQTTGGGFAGMGTRGGNPGGNGPGVDLDGIPGGGWGGPDGPGNTPVLVATRGRSQVTWDKKKTKILGDGLPKSVVGERIGRYRSSFKFCYDKELNRSPNLYGKLLAAFTIGADGRVDDASVLTSSLRNNTVEQCVLRTLRRIAFPKPRGGGEVVVTYPFLFKSAG